MQPEEIRILSAEDIAIFDEALLASTEIVYEGELADGQPSDPL